MIPRAAAALLAASLALPVSAQTAPAAPQKVLHYAIRVAETGFDPAQVSDLYSNTMIANVFDALYQYEFLARPVRIRPNTAAAMPEVSADFKTYTVRLRPGIYFADDPAFKGAKRELVAADYVYSIKRMFDPRWKSSRYQTIANNQILGLEALRTAAIKNKAPFDYDTPAEGLRALDRYTIQFKLGRPNPRFTDEISDPAVTGAVAREVVEFYGDKIMEHPVGTGPFRLATWRRSSLIAFDKNPTYRDEFYNEEAPPNDPLAQAAVAKFKGRKLPLVDRVEVSVIEQPQPRWLSFVNHEMDLIEQVPEDFTNIAIPNNKVAPNLAKQGIYELRYLRADICDRRTSGWRTRWSVATRPRRSRCAARSRWPSTSTKRSAWCGAGRRSSPNRSWGRTSGATTRTLRSEMGEFDRGKAKALLDLYGYVDRDGDGWRELPDGSPLTIEYATQPDDLSRQLITQWKKNMDAIGIRMVFKTAQWPENLKASRVGKLMMWGVGWSGGPDGDAFLVLGNGPDKGQSNHARFDNPEYNRLYDLQHSLPDGPERMQAMTRMKEIMIAYMPYKVHVHRIYTDLAQPWLVGYHRNLFVREFWRYVDIDPAEKARRLK